MKRVTTYHAVLFVLVLIGGLVLRFDPLEVYQMGKTERIIKVPENYSTIQEAINHANPGDTVLVSANTYVENVVVNKSVSIVGENKYTTIVDGNGTGAVFYVVADNVTITGFTIQNGSSPDYGEVRGGVVFDYSFRNLNVSNNIFVNNYYSILVSGSGVNLTNNLVMDSVYGIILNSCQSVLRNNNITRCCYNFGVGLLSFDQHLTNDVDISNTVDGKFIYYLKNQQNVTIDPTTYPNVGYLALINSTNVTIKNLSLKNNYHGILLYLTNSTTIKDVIVKNNTYGILLRFSNTNSLNNITVLDNYSGISLSYSSWNEISNCFVANNGYGISLWGFLINPSHSNKIFENTICNNERGLQTIDSGANKIYHNNFINNYEQAYVEENGNDWYVEYPSGGNYWSDYNGVDNFSGPYQNETYSDGIGDTPQPIPDDRPDMYPLMNPWPSRDITILNISFSKQNPKIGEKMYIYVTIRNKGDLNETFDVSVNYTRTSDPLIGTQTVSLTPRETITITFEWTPTLSGTYEIKAYTSEVPNDIHPEDNTKIVYIIVFSSKISKLGWFQIGQSWFNYLRHFF